MINLAAFLERTRRELLAATDPTFIHHRKYTRELPSKNMSGARYREVWKVRSGNTWQWEVVFDTASASRPGVSYVQRIALRDLAGMIKAKKTGMPMLDKVRYAINDGDLGIYCSCPAHVFWGYKFLNTKLGTNVMGTKENRPPNIRNPQRRGIMCKHLQLALTVLPWNANTIGRDLKKKTGEFFGMDRLYSLL